MDNSKLLSFVIPCYRSEKTIKMVTDEIIDTVKQKPEYDYEIICVNDCSPDNVYEVLTDLAEKNSRIKVINFVKNMGKHPALLAGFSYCSGKIIIYLDDDFQCPATELWRLIEPVESGKADVATAHYDKKKQSALKNFGSNINMAMSHILLGKPKNLRFENYIAMRDYIKDEIIKYNKPYPYMEGLVLRTTRNIAEVKMQERSRGDDNKTGFTFMKSLALWINGFTAFSVKPLRIATFFGITMALIGFVIGLTMIIRKILDPTVLAGYTSMLALLLFIGGIIMIMLGLIGEYIGRIYICINNAPQYVIKNTINLEQKPYPIKHDNY